VNEQITWETKIIANVHSLIVINGVNAAHAYYFIAQKAVYQAAFSLKRQRRPVTVM
jgi:hypothetical protein